MNFSTIESALLALQQGKAIIVVDDEDRENEGDFICAANKVTPAMINLMLTRGRGQVCVAMLPEMCRRLDLPPMVPASTAPQQTAFTVPVDHISSRTGITAQERATTILALIDPQSQPSDFVRPGHMFPLAAKEGGVLRRAGHTEAAVDLMRLADLPAAGVICEILDDTGNRATRDELYKLAQELALEIITIEELIKYRRNREKLVSRVATAELPTKYGAATIIIYQVQYQTDEPIAIIFGDIAGGDNSLATPLVRLHSSCFTGDLISSLRCDCGDQLHLALQRISAEGGVLVYLPQEGRGIGLAEKIKAYHLQDQGMDTVEANLALGHKSDLRDYGIGIQILKDLGLSQIKLLTNNPKKTDAFIYGGFDLRVVDQLPILGEINEHNQRYLQTKREKMGHTL